MKYFYLACRLVLAAALTGMVSAGYAQTLGQYDFTSGACGSQVVTSNPAHATFGSLTNGAGILTCSVTGGKNTITSNTASAPNNAVNWPIAAPTTAGTSYMTFSITPGTGYQVNVTDIVINAARGASGPKNLAIAYNTGTGWSTPALITTAVILGTGDFTASLNQTSLTSTAISFRIYGYNPANTIGTTGKTLIVDYITVMGRVQVPEPTVQSSISVTSSTTSTISLSFTGGNGSRHLVLAKEASAIVVSPADWTTYTASSVFGTGDYIGSFANVVYNGTGNSVTVTGLNPFTNYYFSVFEFNTDGTPGSENYYTTSPGTVNQVTARGIYTWSGGPIGDWTVASNWTPNRAAPDYSDSLVFNTPSVTITNFTDDVISGISLNTSSVTLISSGTAYLYLTNGTGLPSLDISTGSTLILGSNVGLYFDNGTNNIIDGNLVLTDATNIITGYFGDVYVNGSLSLVHSAGFYGTGGAATAIDGDNITNIVLGSSSTINYTGAAQTITTVTPTPYANIAFSGSGIKTPDGDLAVSNLTLGGTAVLDPSTHALSVAGNWTSYAASAFTEIGKTVTFNGTGSQTLNTTGGEIFEGITINNSSLTLSSALRVNGLLTLTAGTLTSGGNLTLNIASAKIPASGAGSISGNLKVERSFTPAKTHYIASPLAGVTAADIADEYLVVSGGKSRLLDLDCSTNKFLGVYDMSTALAQGDAFSMFFPATGTPTGAANTVTFTGSYDHAATSYSSSCSVNTSVKDFFAGNPYPSNVFLGGISGSGTSGVYYILNSAGMFDTYSTPSGTGTGVISAGYVAPMQGFQVETNGLGGTASVTIPSTARDVAQSTSFARVTANANLIRLKATNTTFTDEIVVLFSDEATNDFDLGYDATKMTNSGTNTPNLFTLAGTNELAINNLAISTDVVEVPLNLTTTTTSAYKISFTNKNDFDPSTAVELILADGSVHDLKAESEVTVTTNPVKPYVLRIGGQTITTGTTKATASSTLKAYMNEGVLNVSLIGKSIQTVDVYDITGTRISTGTANSDVYSTPLSIQSGVYIVKVLSGNDLLSTKILVK